MDADARKRLERRLFIGAATNWLAFAATLATAFFLTPYLIGRLGDGPFGIWAFVESILAYFTLFDLGIAACVVRFVARFHASGDRDELNRLTSTALALFMGLGFCLLAVGMLVFAPLASSLQTEGLGRREGLAFGLLMLVNLAITLPLSLFPSILDGLQQFALKSGIRILSLMVRTAGTVWIMEQSPSLLNLGLLFTICNILEHLALALAAYRCLPELHLHWRHINRATFRQVRGYSLHAFLAMLAGRTSVQSGTILVGFFLGAAPVAYFALAVRLVEFAKAFLRTATNALTPAISSLEARGDWEAIRTMFLRGTRWVVALILPIHLGLVVFGRPFLSRWLGDAAYGERCYPALVILSSTLTLVLAQSIAARILYGLGRLRIFARAVLLEAAACLLLGLLLIPRLGLPGAAWAMAIPSFLLCLWVIRHAAREIEAPLRQYIACWISPLLAALPMLSTWLILEHPIESWLSLFSNIIPGVLVYAIAVAAYEFWPVPPRFPWSPGSRASARLLPRPGSDIANNS